MRRTILVLSLVALLLATCSSDSETDRMQTSTGESGSPVSASPIASPSPELRIDWDVPPYSELARRFDYDTSEALDLKVLSEERPRGVVVSDINYRSAGRIVPAVLVMPEGRGPFPAVIYAPTDNSGQGFFLADAVALARDGYAGLVLSSPQMRAKGRIYCFGLDCLDAERNIAAFTAYVTDARHALDLLEGLPRIDAARLGFVGHNVGGHIGAILAAVDGRIDAFVMMYVYASWAAWASDVQGADWGLKGMELADYQERIAWIDAVNYVGHGEGAAFLFQGVTANSVENQQALFDAAPEPKELTWYEAADGWFGCPEPGLAECDPATHAFKSHRAWLQENV